METIKSIEETFDNMPNDIIFKSKPSKVIGIIWMATGVLCLLLNSIIANATLPAVSPALIAIGCLVLIYGIYFTFFNKTKFKSGQSKQTVTFQELFFDTKDRERLLAIIAEKRIQELEKLKQVSIDSLKLRIAATSDGSLCYSQVVTYVPYEFININEACQHSQEEAQTLLNLLKNKKQ